MLGICLSSRHYPHIETKGRNIILEEEPGHKEDIQQYIKTKLRLPTSKHAQSLRVDLLEASRMIFLWVVLVVDILNKDYPGKTINQMRRRLREIPEELGDLFEMILQRDGGDPETLQLCLKWILFAERPMKIEELYFAVQFGLGEEDCSGAWSQDDLDLDTMKISVKEWSKGLSEIKGKAFVVQFIHESVRDFLLGRYKHHWGETSENIEGRSHEILKDCCMAQVKAAIDQNVHTPSTPLETNNEADQYRELIRSKFPFLEYSILKVFHHTNSAQRSGLDQRAFLGQFPFDSWKSLHNHLEKTEIRKYGEGGSFHYLLAERNLADLIRLFPLRGSCFSPEGGVRFPPRYGPPLFAALATGSTEAAHVLLEAEVQGKPSEPRFRGAIQQCLEETKKLGVFNASFRFSKKRGPLSHLAEAAHPTLIEIMLDSAVADIDVNFHNTSSHRSLLAYASKTGHPDTVTLLLKKGANIADRDRDGRTPLSYAAERGHLGILTLLLEKCADISGRDRNGRTALSYAAERGHLGILALLLEEGADIAQTDEKDRTLLSYAAKGGNLGTVALLLEKGADVASRDTDGRTPSSFAAEGGHRDIVTLLLGSGADITSTDNSRRTPMGYAAQEGFLDTVMLPLLESGLPVDMKDENGYTLLSYAAGRGNLSAVKTLLQKGAYIEQRDKRGRTPLSMATDPLFGDGWATVKLLCDSGAQIDTKDAEGRTPLSWAATRGSDQTVSILCDNGAEIDSKDVHGRTPLSWAAGHRGYLSSVRILLEMGADIRSEDNQGHTPLWYVPNGDPEMIKLLRVA